VPGHAFRRGDGGLFQVIDRRVTGTARGYPGCEIGNVVKRRSWRIGLDSLAVLGQDQ